MKNYRMDLDEKGSENSSVESQKRSQTLHKLRKVPKLFKVVLSLEKDGENV
jgi:hypothetical protein